MLVSCKILKEMLNRLEALYGCKLEEALHALEKQFFAATFDVKNGVVEHITKLENLAREKTALGEQISDWMVINKVLDTLPDEYCHFHSAWDSVDKEKKTINNLMAQL